MISLKKITKSYQLGQTQVQALKEISLEIKRGDFLCIAGSSGSGKTTLLNIIGCLDKQDSGSYRLDHEIVDSIAVKDLYKLRRAYIGFIFQSFNLIPVLNTFENVEYPLILEQIPKRERTEMVNRALEEVGLYDRKDHKPDQLSGGQRQRAAIARALVKRPPLILADEPTANLDSVTGNKIIELMMKLNEEDQVTFIFSTHDKEVMEHSRKVFHLKDGEFVEKECYPR